MASSDFPPDSGSPDNADLPADSGSQDNADEPSGAVPRLSRRTWVLVGFGVAALVVVASYVGLTMAKQPVRWQDVGYSIDSPFEATVTYDVYLYTDSPVTCHLQALNVRYIEVGAATQQVSPADGVEQRITTPVTTTETANTVTVHSCEATPQGPSKP